MTENLSPCARAYLAEYGSLPTDRAEQDRYGAFRFGFEAGLARGEQQTLVTWSRAMESAIRPVRQGGEPDA
ncbi:hypothetical protein DEU34_2257 [Microbacterium sp. AG1240]|uniref:hypothetical protein n=1 Tax=Microbacterium sp. AG1240 TaxID=2183992 RepID=UPI000EB13D36|nr:hypothetical protein [Microbacterium sp. AG1240]RKT33654.1 hypothetical protein DEU34_2257 [Microbacterium sp. AG1240]